MTWRVAERYCRGRTLLIKSKKEQSTEETPTNDDVAPPEQELSGSNLKRSKSLRTPRPIVRSTFIPSTATLDPSDPESQVSHLQQPATLSRGVATSNPGSRASSPYVAQTDDARITTVVSPMAETTGGRQRSTSISARQVAHTRSRSVVMRAEKGGLSNQVVLGRSKTPTSMTRISNQQKLKRTNSVENALAADSPMATHPTKTPVKSPVTRTESSGSANGRVTSPLSRNDDPKSSKVSRVLVMGEGTADLNKLASEFSKSLSGEQEEVDGTSMSKSGSLTSSVGGASDSSPLSPSSSHTHLPTSHTSRSSLPAPRSIGPAKSLETSASKSRLAVPGLKGTPPNGGGGGAPTSRPGSAKAYYSVQITSHVDDQERPRSVTATIVPAPMGERRASDDSSPSSGRNTPLERRASAELDGSVKSSTSIDETLKASCETPRTPYRVPKVRTAFTVGGNEQMGLNDLEGSVLLEAEDYRRIAQEVKALKTTLLRFKRELQNEVSGIVPSTPADSKVEKDKSNEEIASLQKESKAKDAKIEALSSEVTQLRADNLKLAESLKELETHRNGLLEKVERLHADKHKLENRLNTLENARYYELSESMCVESLQEEDLDGSLLMVDEVDDDLGEMSNSDIHTSSEGTGSGSFIQS